MYTLQHYNNLFLRLSLPYIMFHISFTSPILCKCCIMVKRCCLNNINIFHTNKLLLLLSRVMSFTAGKRKFDGGHQNQGESKRRFQSNWGNQPLAQQPLGNAYGLASVNGGSGGGGGDIGFGSRVAELGGLSGDDHEWYQDSYQSWS